MNNAEIIWNIPVPGSGLSERVRSAAEFVLADEGLDNTEVAVIFIDNPAMQQLNALYRKIDEPTDVLSFPQFSSRSELQDEMRSAGTLRDPFVHLGDIAVSLEYAENNSSLFAVDWKEEILPLVMHGTLHLLGYEHESIDTADPMLARQELLLRRFLKKEKKINEFVFTEHVSEKTKRR